MVASKFAMASLSISHFRPFSSAASPSASASYPTRLVAHPPDLIKWVRTQGGFVHQAVKIALDGHHSLGLFASENIDRGSELICLPDHLPLRFESASPQSSDGVDPVMVNLARQIPGDSSLGIEGTTPSLPGDIESKKELIENMVLELGSFSLEGKMSSHLGLIKLFPPLAEELWAMKLGLKLLQERAKVGSFWWPYISNLPDTYSVPIFFLGDNIKNLQYAPLLSQVNKRCRFLLSFEDEVKRVIESMNDDDHPFSRQDVNASSLGWAMSAVSSRAFRLHGKKLLDGAGNYVPSMLPLIDMCNHSFTPNARIVQEQDAGLSNQVKVVAETKIEGNDQLFLNYGCLDNDLFLLDYGFIVTSNPYDCIELKYDEALLDAASIVAGVTSPNFTAPSNWQKQILIQLNLDGESPDLKVRIGGLELVDGRLLAALRVLLSSDEEKVRKHDLNKLKSSSDEEAPLGVTNEIAALRTVVSLCLIALSHFPTKIMEDEALLEGNSISDSSKLAIKYRIQKKSVIVDAVTNLTRRVKRLQSKEIASPQV